MINRQNSTIPAIVGITVSALNMAIVELKSGDTNLCLETLTSLERILQEFTRMETPDSDETGVQEIENR
jgi:hypothetical protein